MSEKPTEHEHAERETSKYSEIKEKRNVGHITFIMTVNPANPPFFNTVSVCFSGVGLGQVTFLYVPALPQSAFSWLTEKGERDFPSFVLQTRLNNPL